MCSDCPSLSNEISRSKVRLIEIDLVLSSIELIQDVPVYHSFLLGFGVVENVASFTDGTSLPVVDLSGDVPNVVPGLLLTESVKINEVQCFVTTKLVTPKILIPGKFVAPPPFRDRPPPL